MVGSCCGYLRTLLALKLEDPGLLHSPGWPGHLPSRDSVSEPPGPAHRHRHGQGRAEVWPPHPGLRLLAFHVCEPLVYGKSRHSAAVRVSPTAGRLQPGHGEQIAEVSCRAGVISVPGVDPLGRARLGSNVSAPRGVSWAHWGVYSRLAGWLGLAGPGWPHSCV